MDRIKLCRVLKIVRNIPKARTLSGVNAGTIFENMRQGIVMLSTIWLAPRAATVGKISILVIIKPQVTQNTLKKIEDIGWGEWSGQRFFLESFLKFETYRRIRGRHDIQMRAPTDSIIQSVQIILPPGKMK